MILASLTFIFIFFPIVFLIGNLLNIKLQNIFLLIASLIFYAWGEPIYIFLILISIIVNYIAGIIIDNSKNSISKNIFFIITLLIDIGILGYYKYANLFFGTNIPLPIGISFFTFQEMSYVIDVYRGDAKVQKKFINLALYVSLFPQLIAGPIIRYKNIDEQIEYRVRSNEKTAIGIKRFIYGLSKKVILANTLGFICDTILSSKSIQNVGTVSSWIIAMCYTLQIYYDFSGYSDMAIGIGKMFGFEFPENFNYPYLSKSITEFWRRWHITLSSWFRDYVYIPLGGNRKGPIRKCINLMIIFLLTGFWHGASWNFVVWGVIHGIFVVIEFIFLKKILDKIPIINHLYTLCIVSIAFIIFKFENTLDGLLIIHRMINLKFLSFDGDLSYIFTKYNIFIFTIAIIFSGPLQSLYKLISTKKQNSAKIILNIFEYFVLLILFSYSITELVSNTYNPFIYMRF